MRTCSIPRWKNGTINGSVSQLATTLPTPHLNGPTSGNPKYNHKPTVHTVATISNDTSSGDTPSTATNTATTIDNDTSSGDTPSTASNTATHSSREDCNDQRDCTTGLARLAEDCRPETRASPVHRHVHKQTHP